MPKPTTTPATTLRIAAAMVCAAAAALFATPAAAAPYEGVLASPSQALAYCQAGTMPANDVAYIAGAGGLAQYGSANS